MITITMTNIQRLLSAAAIKICIKHNNTSNCTNSDKNNRHLYLKATRFLSYNKIEKCTIYFENYLVETGIPTHLINSNHSTMFI